MCVLVQIETREALKKSAADPDVEGVDGVFIGPADLSADMGHGGNPQHPEVQAAIEDAIQQIRQAGKAPGILMANEQLAKRYLELGALSRRRRRRYHPVSLRRRSAGGPFYPHRNHHNR